ncbi:MULTISPECIES: GNAT family N-acetyltransferase [Catenuloplanes]|uniref:GNAT superfamily N-acetyltransferase n=1 Tax=Catenuloplanes niger TaxID=587534 RepID=A0AAE4CS58_9ACTN|nr:GNAT family N-acetyltransferase [Catenuloplanes niger]MDR7322660.1 GNAT superfamily N-acetyltransferase [Catenuloplanes niger]
MNASPTIRRDGTGELLPVTDVLVDALFDGDLAPWLAADPGVRASIYPGYLGMLAEPLLEHGYADMIGSDAVALWTQVTDDLPPEPSDYEARLREVCGPRVQRFADLDSAMVRNHPTDRPHAYLAFLAVTPHAQGQGLGSALLAHANAHLDAIGMPAYLEATGPRNRQLYLQHGYADYSDPFPVGLGGPVLYPMWRDPRA